MPPKKTEKEEAAELLALPPWSSVCASINFCTRKKFTTKLKEKIKSKPLSFQKIVTRDDIVNFAKEKGYYVDPNNLTDKQKKDPKAMAELPMEMTSLIMAKSFKQYLIEQDLQGRRV